MLRTVYLESLSALHLAHVEEELLALLLLVGQEPELTCHNKRELTSPTLHLSFINK